MNKKLKEALIGYLNNVSEVYYLYSQDSWSNDDFRAGALFDWSLDIMEECINDKGVKQVLKLMRKAREEGVRVSELPYNDLGEKDDEEIHDAIIAEEENLKSKLTL